MLTQITSLTIVFPTVYSDADKKKTTPKPRATALSAGNSPGTGSHRSWPGTGDFPHKWPVTRIMFQFDDVIMQTEFLGV